MVRAADLAEAANRGLAANAGLPEDKALLRNQVLNALDTQKRRATLHGL